MHAGSRWLGGTLQIEPEQPIFLRYNLLNTFDFFKQRCKREIASSLQHNISTILIQIG